MKVGDFVRRKYGLKYRYGVVLRDLFNHSKTNRGKAYRVQWTSGRKSNCIVHQLELVEADK